MKKILKYSGIVILAVFVIIQFIRPELNDGGYESVASFEKETRVSKDIAAILKTNCYDCHSNQTDYPWYSNVSPVSLWLEDHVNHAKGELNVSVWDTYSIKRKEHKLEEVIEMVNSGEMPLNSYTWIHGNLEENDKVLLIQWATLAQIQYQKLMEVSTK
jgi:hypothetical protein